MLNLMKHESTNFLSLHLESDVKICIWRMNSSWFVFYGWLVVAVSSNGGVTLTLTVLFLCLFCSRFLSAILLGRWALDSRQQCLLDHVADYHQKFVLLGLYSIKFLKLKDAHHLVEIINGLITMSFAGKGCDEEAGWASCLQGSRSYYGSAGGIDE